MEIHAAQVTTWGSPPQYLPFTLPPPTPTQHRVRVLASGLHNLVRSRAAGRHYTVSPATTPLPHIPGVDGVGALDDDDGSLVYFNALHAPTGAMAQYINLDRKDVYPLPKGADPAALAAVVNGTLSGWMALTTRAGVVPGSGAGFTVCVLGATGVSGLIAVRIAKAMGARRVVAVGRNPVGLEQARQNGADEIVRFGEQPFKEVDFGAAAADVDIVLDYIWGEATSAAMKSILTQRRNPNQRLTWVGIGGLGGQILELDQSLLRKSNTFVCGCGPGAWNKKEQAEQLPKMLEVLVQNEVKADFEVRKLKDVEKSWTETGTKRLVFEP
ncbi:MAG: hypothetical protein M1821_001195 [Bathelium mastoideum]|nr:MAG: hypothetical protein M1821_001195 [Bathelium mastoideum]